MKKTTSLQKKLSITVGIPAYNESAHIAVLLECILKQQLKDFALEKIIVISDASDDETVRAAKSVDDSRIKVIVGRRRIGASQRQNQVFSLARTDIVVLLNADILPVNKTFLQGLCLPLISKENIGLVGAKIIPLSQNSSLVGKVLDWHHEWKNELFQKINHGDTVYMCHGRARAFSRKLYRKLRWPGIAGEDAYSYMKAKHFGFDFAFAPIARVWYTSPQTLEDHMRQSSRFFLAKKSKKKLSPAKNQVNWYHIPKILLVLSAIKAVVSHPAYALIYALLLSVTLTKCMMVPNNKKLHLWQMSPTTKNFSYDNL